MEKNKTTEYGELLLRSQRDTSLLLATLVSITAYQTKEKKLIDMSVDLGNRVSETAEKINEFLGFDNE